MPDSNPILVKPLIDIDRKGAFLTWHWKVI